MGTWLNPSVTKSAGFARVFRVRLVTSFAFGPTFAPRAAEALRSLPETPPRPPVREPFGGRRSDDDEPEETRTIGKATESSGGGDGGGEAALPDSSSAGRLPGSAEDDDPKRPLVDPPR